MKPKQYLMDNGHITSMGRGRMSAEHIAIIREAVKSGVFIEGYSQETTPKPVADKTGTSKPKARETTIADIGEERRPESQWQATVMAGDGTKKFVGMRTVCNNCHSSLTYCGCRVPVVFVDFDTHAIVTFAPRTAPLSTRNW